MTTVISNKVLTKLGTTLGLLTAVFASVELTSLLFGVERQPPYYLLALFIATVVCSELGRISR